MGELEVPKAIIKMKNTSLSCFMNLSIYSMCKNISMCKNMSSKINCVSAIGQHLITNPECAKTYTDDNFQIIGQARSSFHLDVLESVYIKTQNSVLCRQKEFVFSLKLFN